MPSGRSSGEVEGRTVNWSETPFADLPLKDAQEVERAERFARIRADMEGFVRRALPEFARDSAMGIGGVFR